MKNLRFTALFLIVSLAVCAVGTVVEAKWGASAQAGSTETNWVDQTFGLLMYLGMAAVMAASVALVLLTLIAGARWSMGWAARHRHGH